MLMKVLEGNFQRNIALNAPHPGGLPRKWKRMKNFDELEDVDPFEIVHWAENTLPHYPGYIAEKNRYLAERLLY